MPDIIKARGLTEKQLRDIKELNEICSKFEPLYMKLNWSMLENRSMDSVNDFLCYEGDKLIGFIGLYDILPQEIEVTGMVHPDFRRKGIFTRLYKLAMNRCREVAPQRILLISEHSKDAGIAFVKKIGAKYTVSEYRMKCEKSSVSHKTTNRINLRKAVPEDFKALFKLDKRAFNDSGDGEDSMAGTYESTMVAELKGVFVGKIGLLKEGPEGYIYGFVVVPELRGKGYGTEILCMALQKFLSEDINTVFLEVALNNESALKLYKSCGFREECIYDYYEIVFNTEI